MERKRHSSGALETRFVFINRRRFCDRYCMARNFEKRVNGHGDK